MLTILQTWNGPERRAAAAFAGRVSQANQLLGGTPLGPWSQPGMTALDPNLEGLMRQARDGTPAAQLCHVRSGHEKLRKLDKGIREASRGAAVLDAALGGIWFHRGAVCWDFSDLVGRYTDLMIRLMDPEDDAGLDPADKEINTPESWVTGLYWVLGTSEGVEYVALRPNASEGILGVYYVWESNEGGLTLSMYWESKQTAPDTQIVTMYHTVQTVRLEALTGSTQWGGLHLQRLAGGNPLTPAHFTWDEHTAGVVETRGAAEQSGTTATRAADYMHVTMLNLMIFYALKNKTIEWSERKPAKPRKKGSRRNKGSSALRVRTCRVDSEGARTLEKRLTGMAAKRSPSGPPVNPTGPYTGAAYHVKEYDRAVWVHEANVQPGEEWLDIKQRKSGGILVQVLRECNRKGYTVGDVAEINLTRAIPAHLE